MTNAATVDIKGKPDDLNKALQQSHANVAEFGSKVTKVFAAIGAAMAARQLFDWGKGFVSAFAESEEAEAKLAAVIKATGGAAGFTTSQLVGLSEQLQTTTKFEAETTQGAMAVLASFRNIRGDNFVEATKTMQDMATVMGGDLAGTATQLGKALNDPVQGMAALTKVGVTFTQAQKDAVEALIETGDVVGAQQIILKELANEFGGAAEAVGQTTAGMREQVINRWGDIAEDLGEIIVGMLDSLQPALEGVTAFVENLVPIIGEVVQGFALMGKSATSGFGPVLEWLLDAAITTFTGIEWAVSNFAKLWERTLVSAELMVVQFGNTVIHWVGTVIPDFLSWFGRNWREVFTDMANLTLTVLTNVGKNIVDFVAAIGDALSGKGFNFEFTALTDGFESALKELPKIAERELGPLEKELGKQLKKLDNELGNDFGQKFNDNKKAFVGMFEKPPAKDVGEDLKNNNADLNFDPDDFKTKKEKEKKAKKEKEDEGKTVIEDLLSLSKRIESANEKAKEKAEKEADKKEAKDNVDKVAEAHGKAVVAVENLGKHVEANTKKLADVAEKKLSKHEENVERLLTDACDMLNNLLDETSKTQENTREAADDLAVVAEQIENVGALQ